MVRVVVRRHVVVDVRVEKNIIIGILDRLVGEKIVCFFVPNEKYSKNDEKIINKQIIEKLGYEFRVDKFFKLNKIPLNNNGKIDKQKIKIIYETKNDS